jgi:transposase
MTPFVLSRRDRARLRRQLKHTQDAALYRRTLALVELDQGKSIAAMAGTLGVSRQTVYNWIETYNESYDPLSLRDAARSGRPSSWTPDLQELLHVLLKERPGQWGLPGTSWTVPLLRQQLASWDGRWLSADTLRRHLHRLGYVWKRTRYVLPPDPELEKKNNHSPEAEKPAPA